MTFSELPPADILAALRALEGPRSFTVCRRDLDVWIQHGAELDYTELIADLEQVIAGLRAGRVQRAEIPDLEG